MGECPWPLLLAGSVLILGIVLPSLQEPTERLEGANTVTSLSADDLLTRALAKTNAVKTVRIEINSEIEERGEVIERLKTNIKQAVNDIYISRATELKIDGEWQILHHRSSERLLYRGKTYTRSPSGGWELELFGVGPGVAAYVTVKGATKAVPRSLPYGINFEDVSDLENRGNEALDDRTPVVHLAGRLSRQSFGDRKEIVDAVSTLPAADQLLETLRNRSGARIVDIWIGAHDQLLKRFVVREQIFDRQQLVRRVQTTAQLSGFDEDLELPGPLPKD